MELTYSLQPTLVVTAPDTYCQLVLAADGRDRCNSQLKSESVMAPDRTVRTVQQMAVLCIISQMNFL